MEKRHRVFVAINLPEDIKKELAKKQEKLKDKFVFAGQDDLQVNLARWTTKNNLHITLVFLGYLTDQEIAEVCRTVKEVATQTSAFSINLNRLEYGPPVHSDKLYTPSMIWASGEKSKELSEFKNNLQNALLESVSFSPEERIFSPHITLARLKEWQLKSIDIEERPEVAENMNLIFTVEIIEVMESVIKKGSLEYEVLESCELKI